MAKAALNPCLESPHTRGVSDIVSQKACMIWLGPQNGIIAKLMVLMPENMCATTQQKRVRPVMVWFVITIGYLRGESEVMMDRRGLRRKEKKELIPGLRGERNHFFHLRGKQMARYRSRAMVNRIREFKEPK